MSESVVLIETPPEPPPVADQVELIEAQADATADVIEAQADAEVKIIEARADNPEWQEQLSHVTQTLTDLSLALDRHRTETTEGLAMLALRLDQLTPPPPPPEPPDPNPDPGQSEGAADGAGNTDASAPPEAEPEPAPEPKTPERKRAHRWI